MAGSKNSVDRRQFVRLAAAGAVPSAGLLKGAGTGDALTPGAGSSQQKHSPHIGRKLRIATTQTNRSPYARGLSIDPFHKQFVAKDIPKSVDGWLKWYEELIARAAKQQCQLVVLTEDITNLGHVMTYLDDRSLFRDTVKWQTPRVAERLGAVARKHSIHIVASYYAQEKEDIYNVADLFGPNGDILGRYRKVHLPEYELWQVAAGSEFPAFETDLGWISMLICYDQMWPESVSCCALNGAQLVCQPSAAELTDYHMRTRARDNQIHFVSSTWRNSMIVSPKAKILACAQKEDPAVVWADVDLVNATKPPDDYFWEELYSGIKDHKERRLKFRRPDAYGVLVEKHPPLANQYPKGGVANTPEAIERVYRKYKKLMQDKASGKKLPYHWTF